MSDNKLDCPVDANLADQHEMINDNIGSAELQDEILFKQPESSHYGDCPICCLPLPIDGQKSILMSCCGKSICNGCDIADQKRQFEGRLQRKCPFCRKAVPKTDEECIEQLMKRIEANDPVAMCQMGTKRCEEGDYNSAFEYLTWAAVLGNVQAHHQLSCLYYNGEGVEKDEKRALHHSIEAAIGGHPLARHNLAILEWKNGHHDRAAKHFIIAAKLGCDESLDKVKVLYKGGHASKDDFAAALRGHQTAVDATKSPQREAADGYMKWLAEHGRNGHNDRAAKHFIIAAKLGDDDSLEAVKDFYKDGYVTKDDFAATLRGHQTAVDATKSPQRDQAAAFHKMWHFIRCGIS
eukprot:scaffold3926_cov126-Skeletonema_menzelii.AAC.5